MSIDQLPNEDFSVPSGVLDNDFESGDFESGSESFGPCCEKCGAPIAVKETLVCQKCGWYASIGTYVEIDKSWEIASNPDLATEDDLKPAPKAKLPTWAYLLMGCVVGVIAESLAARLLTSDGSAVRTIWSLTQLLVGFVTFGVCHTCAFSLVMKNEADIKMMDYLLRPIKTWSMIFRDLPERSWVCYCGMGGLTAVAMSLLVIGAIPYERLLDWDVKEKAKSNLMGAIIEQAQNLAAEEEQGLEDAIGDFAGKAELDDKKKNPDAKQRQKEDCIIVGYMANKDGEIQTLLLAAEHFAKLKYAGNVRATDLSDEDLHDLTEKLKAIRTHKSFVRKSISGATWVKPKYLCRVSYKRRGKQGGLFGTKVEGLLGEVNLSSK